MTAGARAMPVERCGTGLGSWSVQPSNRGGDFRPGRRDQKNGGTRCVTESLREPIPRMSGWSWLASALIWPVNFEWPSSRCGHLRCCSPLRAVREINPRGDRVSDFRFVSSLAAVHFAIGQEYHKIDKLGYARESSERARVLWKQAVAAKPGNTQYRSRLLATDQVLQQIERELARRSQQDGVL